MVPDKTVWKIWVLRKMSKKQKLMLNLKHSYSTFTRVDCNRSRMPKIQSKRMWIGGRAMQFFLEKYQKRICCALRTAQRHTLREHLFVAVFLFAFIFWYISVSVLRKHSLFFGVERELQFVCMHFTLFSFGVLLLFLVAVSRVGIKRL